MWASLKYVLIGIVIFLTVVIAVESVVLGRPGLVGPSIKFLASAVIFLVTLALAGSAKDSHETSWISGIAAIICVITMFTTFIWGLELFSLARASGV